MPSTFSRDSTRRPSWLSSEFLFRTFLVKHRRRPSTHLLSLLSFRAAITAAKAIPVVVGDRQKVKGSDGVVHKGDFTLETSRSTHFDAIAIVGGSGDNYASKLNVGRLVHAAREAYMHQKAIMVLGQAVDWLAQAALPGQGLDLSGQDGVSDGIIYSRAMPVSSLKTFLDVVAKHRVWSRDVSTVAA